MLASAASTAGCATDADDAYYQYRIVEYSVSVDGPHEMFTVWFRDGRDIREEHPDPSASTWERSVTGKFYEPVGLDLQAEAHMREENASPVPTDVTCEITVDGRTYSRNTHIHTSVCQVDFAEVKTPPASADDGGSSVTPALLVAAAVAVAATILARWAYVRRRRARGTWPTRTS